jgi:hypothetical protein
MEFAFMNLAYFPEHNNSQSHPFPEKWHNFIFLYG